MVFDNPGTKGAPVSAGKQTGVPLLFSLYIIVFRIIEFASFHYFKTPLP